MKKYIKIFFIPGLFLFAMTACDKSMDRLLDNPNYPSPSTADVDLYLNVVQLSFKIFLTMRLILAHN